MARPRRLADLPTEFAVFPLEGALLLPHGRLPLNIFEPRYLAMVEDAMAAGRMFGMIQPDASRGEAGRGPAPFFRVGCLGRLSSFSETDDGRYLISLTGLVRYEVLEELPVYRGYRRVRASCAAYEADLDPPEPQVGVARPVLLDALRAFFAARGLEANWEAVGQMPDPELVVTLCMACPFDPSEKQALLEADLPSRAATLLALLQMGAHEQDSSEQHRSVS
jgi:Lon protease-like protein